MKGFKRSPVRAATIALLALALPLSACSGGGKEAASSGADASAAASAAPLDISWLSFNPPDNDSTPVQQALEKEFNVKFKNVRVERTDYDEQMNIKFSSGDIADLIYLDFSPQRLETLVDQGVLAELPEDEIRSKMPAYADTIDQADPALWDYSQVNGKNYGIPVIWPIGDLPFLPGYNGDWLKKIGYDAPPTTLDQFADVLRKFRNDDPDGDGKKDTYGLSGQGTDARSFSVVFGAFGIRPDYMVDEKTKQVVYGLTTEQGREALKVLSSWYKEGLIDPEFVTKTANDYHDDFVNGIVGIRDWMSYQFEPRVGIVGAPFYAKNPNNQIVVGKPLAGPDGPGKAYSYGSQNAFITMGKQVEKDPAKKAKLYEMLNALATDDQTYLTSVYGIEGEHYEMQDGIPIMKPEYANENAKYKIGAGTFYGVFGTKSKLMEKYDYTKDTLKFIDSLRDGVQTINSLAVYVPAMTEYPDLDKLTSEYYLKFVRGELNLDTDFDKFVQAWNDAGGQEILQQINAKYKFGA